MIRQDEDAAIADIVAAVTDDFDFAGWNVSYGVAVVRVAKDEYLLEGKKKRQLTMSSKTSIDWEKSGARGEGKICLVSRRDMLDTYRQRLGPRQRCCPRAGSRHCALTDRPGCTRT